MEALGGNYWFVLVSLEVELSCVLVGISKGMNKPGKFVLCIVSRVNTEILVRVFFFSSQLSCHGISTRKT